MAQLKATLIDVQEKKLIPCNQSSASRTNMHDAHLTDVRHFLISYGKY
ncbi:hypothetical protein MIZ01_2288 [Sideroxyarcus emersonii]|uniref:Uncharacterized protein n=1 Tax=Sideroxyarcus emersonii TaxID=2764705 RepID=A0AAN1XC63_9PROT|nr:hypothetical protein MIZ01_2288 [Sideroxyarcus emersonii]